MSDPEWTPMLGGRWRVVPNGDIMVEVYGEICASRLGTDPGQPIIADEAEAACEIIRARVTPKAKAEIRRLAERAGLHLGAYITETVAKAGQTLMVRLRACDHPNRNTYEVEPQEGNTLGPGWQLIWCTDCGASLHTHPSIRFAGDPWSYPSMFARIDGQ